MDDPVKLKVCNRCHATFEVYAESHVDLRYHIYGPRDPDDPARPTHSVTHYDLCGRCSADLRANWMQEHLRAPYDELAGRGLPR